MQTVMVDIFSDVLCIWAYGAQARFDELKKQFGEQIRFRYFFIPLFAATQQKIGEGWKDRGGFEGFNAHLQEVGADWEHIVVHPEIWLENRPASSGNAHLYIKAVQLLEASGDIAEKPQGKAHTHTPFENFVWRVRCQFFEYNRNIAHFAQLDEIAEGLDLPVKRIRSLIEEGEVSAALHLDVEARDRYLVPGSPTLVFNEGRQRLYGNVGYRIIEANIQELLENHYGGAAVWC